MASKRSARLSKEPVHPALNYLTGLLSSRSKAGGDPPALPRRRLRLPVWSVGSGTLLRQVTAIR